MSELTIYEKGMKMTERADWSKWNEELESFKDRNTEGFMKDLAALEAHIKKLRKVSPKDKIGFPHMNAFDDLTRLASDLEMAKRCVVLHAK